MEQTADRSVVLAVVTVLGVIAVTCVIGVIVLVSKDKDPAAVAIVSGMAGTAIGGLVGLLANTRTAQPAVAQAEAVGYQKAVDAVNALPAAPPV